MNSNEYQLVAAVDVNKKKLCTFGKYFSDVKVSTNIQDVLIDNPDINMAVIAVPTDKHLDILNELKMFENLKYVILEKPAGMNHFEAETIQRLALENDWKCYINYIRRADKSVAQIKESLKKHTEVQVRCFFNGNSLNIGVHFIDLLLHIFQLFGKNYSIATSKNKLFIEYNYVSISIEKFTLILK